MTRLHIKHLEQCLFHQKHTTDMSSLWVISRPPQCCWWPNLYSSLSYKHQNRIFKNLLCIPRGCSNSSSVWCLIVNFFFSCSDARSSSFWSWHPGPWFSERQIHSLITESYPCSLPHQWAHLHIDSVARSSCFSLGLSLESSVLCSLL